MDEPTLNAYERYVLAQFKFQEAAQIEQERNDAINSLIPGTKHYYHLYFLNLVKQQKLQQDFTEEEAELYQKFGEKFGEDPLFYEVETWLTLINPMEKLPKMTQDIGKGGLSKYTSIIKLLAEKYLKAEDRLSDYHYSLE